MTRSERKNEERALELSIAINKEKLIDMERMLNRLRALEVDIAYRKKELATLQKQKLKVEKLAKFVLA